MTTAGTVLLFTRLGDLCRQMGLTANQAAQVFDALPPGVQQLCWDDLAARVVGTREAA